MTARIRATIAIALAYAGQLCFDEQALVWIWEQFNLNLPPPNLFVPAIALYLIAMVLFASTVTQITLPTVLSPTTMRTARDYWPRIVWLALLVAVLNGARFVVSGEDVWTRLLWLLSMALFTLPLAQWSALLPRIRRALQQHWRWLLLGSALLAIGFWLRFYNVANLPSDLHGDMASYGQQSREYLFGADKRIFRIGWADIPMHGFMPYIATMRLFGNNLFGLNMGAVLSGTLIMALVVAIVWRLSASWRLALLTMVLVAVNIPNIHFSRIVAYIDPWVFSLLGLYFLIEALQRRQPFAFAAAGVMFGIAVQMYYSGRVIIFIVLAFLGLLLLLRRWQLLSAWPGLFLSAAGFLVAIGPMLIYFTENFEGLVSRSRAVYLFTPPVMTHLQGKYEVTTVNAVVLEQIKRSVLMFHDSIDSSTQFGLARPMFTLWVSPWIALGFAALLRWWRSPAAILALCFWGVQLVLGSVLTNNAPFWPRLVAMPLVGAVMAAVAVLWFGRLLEGWRWRPVLSALLIGLLVALGWSNWTFYATNEADNAREQARIGRFLSTVPENTTACTFVDPHRLNRRETQFLAWPRTLFDFTAAGPLPQCGNTPLVWILAPPYIDRLLELRQRWPDGVVTEHAEPSGRLVFTSFEVATGATTTLEPGIAEPVAVSSSARYADGTIFEPTASYLGDTNSQAIAHPIGRVMVTGGELTVTVGPLNGYDSVIDYVLLIAENGDEYRVEAEAVFDGDTTSDGASDGLWWRQAYGPFSGGEALVAQAGEQVEVVVVSMAVPDGLYSLRVGTFTGDPNNGVFGFGIDYTVP